MITSEEIAERYLQIDEDRFYVFDESDKSAIYDRYGFGEEDFRGLALAMPAVVDLATRSRVPAIVFDQRDALRGWEMNSYDNLAVIAVSRGTGQVFTRRVEYNEKREMMRKKPVRVRGPRPTGDSAKARHAGVRAVDLLARTLMPQTQDDYVVRAVEFDWLSNAVNVQVKARPPAALAPMSASGLDPAQYTKSTLAAPADGLILSAPASVQPGAAGIIVSGAGRIGLPNSATILREPTPDGVRALIRGALVVARKDDTPPAVVELKLPVFGNAPLKAGDVIEIYFAQNLAEHLGAAGAEYRIYWVVDRYISAPSALKVDEQ